jgi:hypothetical protein
MSRDKFVARQARQIPRESCFFAEDLAKLPTFPRLLQPRLYRSIPLRLAFLTSIVSDKMQAFSRCARPALQAVVRRQGYSTATSGYAATAENLRINKDTKVIYQGFTGKQGT